MRKIVLLIKGNIQLILIAHYRNPENKFTKLFTRRLLCTEPIYQWSSRPSNLNPPNHTLL
jgi:hypothetical protein